MKFENKSKSLLPIDRATLKQLCVQFGKDPRKLPKYGELSDSNYIDYMKAITGYRPCFVCNGPRGIVKLDESRVNKFVYRARLWESQTLAIYSPIRCLRYPIHSIIENSQDPLSNWSRVSINLCEHGYYFVECKDCHEALNKTKEVLSELANTALVRLPTSGN